MDLPAAHSPRAAGASIPAGSRSGDLPLSFSEALTWLRAQRFAEYRALNTFVANRLIGALHRDALRSALRELVRRHEILRTGFVVKDDQPVRAIHEPMIDLAIVDLQHHADASREAEAHRLTLEEIAGEFDMTAPMLRAKLLILAPDQHVLVLTVHHAIADAWSLGIIAGELKLLYRAHARGEASALPPLRIQYADYAIWTHAQLTAERRRGLAERWRRRLEDPPAPLDLPLRSPLDTSRVDTSAATVFELPPALVEAVKIVSRRRHVTPFITLLSGFTTVLYRLTGQAAMMIMIPVSERGAGDLQSMIGGFVDLVPVRIGCSGAATFSQHLEHVRDACRVLYANERLPLLVLAREVADLRHKAMGQIVFNVVNWRDPQLDLPGLTAEEWPTGFDMPVRSALTLNVRLFPNAAKAEGILKYRSDCFAAEWIRRFTDQIRDLLAQATADPDTRLDEYSFDAHLKKRSA
jgi:hypothetical protein